MTPLKTDRFRPTYGTLDPPCPANDLSRPAVLAAKHRVYATYSVKRKQPFASKYWEEESLRFVLVRW